MNLAGPQSHLVDGLNNPVDAGIATNGLVLGVDEDNLEVFVGRVLVDPVRIQDSEIGAATSYTLLCRRFERALVLQLINTLIGGFACDASHISTTPAIDVQNLTDRR